MNEPVVKCFRFDPFVPIPSKAYEGYEGLGDCDAGCDLAPRAVVGPNMSKYAPFQRETLLNFSDKREGFTLIPGGCVCLGFGVVFELPLGHIGYVVPRSSTVLDGIKLGTILCFPMSSVPVDQGFRGEVIAVLANIGRGAFEFNVERKLFQLVVLPSVSARMIFVDNYEDLTPSIRGCRCNGSSNR